MKTYGLRTQTHSLFEELGTTALGYSFNNDYYYAVYILPEDKLFELTLKIKDLVHFELQDGYHIMSAEVLVRNLNKPRYNPLAEKMRNWTMDSEL